MLTTGMNQVRVSSTGHVKEIFKVTLAEYCDETKLLLKVHIPGI